MSNVEDGIEKCIRVEEKTELPEVTKSSTVYHFDEDDLKNETWKNCRKWIMENLMLLTTLAAVIIGVTAGLSLRQFDLCKDTIIMISYPGELFMRILKLMILPLVIASLITGSASINAKMNGKIALRTFVYFASTSLFNAILGTGLAIFIHPGSPDMHSELDLASNPNSVNLMDSMLDIGRNIFTDNIFQASFQSAYTNYVPKKHPFELNDTDTVSETSKKLIFVNANPVAELKEEREMIPVVQYRSGTNMLGIVFFCLVFGTILGTIGEKGHVVINFFTAVFEVIMKMVILACVWLSPIGISSVIAGKILSVDNLSLVISQLLLFIITVASGVFLYQFIVLQAIYFLIVRKNPFKFYGELVQPLLYAFASASKTAALPLTFQVLEQKVNIDKRITRFILPIGVLNMDGTALYISVSAIFIAQMSSMSLGLAEIITVILTSFAASMSVAPVPSAALVLLVMVLTSINVPLQDVTLLFAIDWFVDRIRTTNNMLGDCYTCAVVEHLSKAELMACDAVNSLPNHISTKSRNDSVPELIVVNVESDKK
ncbi:excitatory amino acid transporter [Chironomus tepperi]|uniref:excitatory amino acid transporter n=1 Tax=Chironomus tepperi TaxID=113505 RepID=UPI00391FB2AB